jgi:hypothetical protein
LGTAFTYQGHLTDGGTRAKGNYDFQFALYDMPDSEDPIGPALDKSIVAVSNGLFSVALDFGTNAFTGEARWLGISVRSSDGNGEFTELMPRQPLTPAPYALFTPYATRAAEATVITGGIADDQLSSNIARLNGNATFAGALTAATFVGNGSGLTNLPARPDGATLYVDINGNDLTAVRGRMDRPWATVNAAVSNALAGDCVSINAGTYDLGTTPIYLATHGSLVGAGRLSTILQSRASTLTDGPCIVPQDGSLIQRLTIQGMLTNGAYQAPIGSVQPPEGSPASLNPLNWAFHGTARVEDVRTIADSDGLHLATTNACEIKAHNVELISKYDAVSVLNPGTSVQIEDFTIEVQGPSATGSGKARGIWINTGGSCSARRGVIVAKSGGTGGTFAVQCAGAGFLDLSDIVCEVSNASGMAFDIGTVGKGPTRVLRNISRRDGAPLVRTGVLSDAETWSYQTHVGIFVGDGSGLTNLPPSAVSALANAETGRLTQRLASTEELLRELRAEKVAEIQALQQRLDALEKSLKSLLTTQKGAAP